MKKVANLTLITLITLIVIWILVETSEIKHLLSHNSSGNNAWNRRWIKTCADAELVADSREMPSEIQNSVATARAATQRIELR